MKLGDTVLTPSGARAIIIATWERYWLVQYASGRVADFPPAQLRKVQP